MVDLNISPFHAFIAFVISKPQTPDREEDAIASSAPPRRLRRLFECVRTASLSNVVTVLSTDLGSSLFRGIDKASK